MDHTVRLSLGHENHVSQRVRKSSVDRTVRLSLDRKRHITQRETEMPEERHLRLINYHIWHRTVRNIIQNNSSTTQNINRLSNKEYSAIN